MKRVYYSPDLDQFRTHLDIGVQTRTPSSHALQPGKLWVRMCEQGVLFMERSIESAFQNDQVSDDKLSDAIIGYYRARRCVETEGQSEGFPALLAMPWDQGDARMQVFFAKKR